MVDRFLRSRFKALALAGMFTAAALAPEAALAKPALADPFSSEVDLNRPTVQVEALCIPTSDRYFLWNRHINLRITMDNISNAWMSVSNRYTERLFGLVNPLGQLIIPLDDSGHFAMDNTLHGHLITLLKSKDLNGPEEERLEFNMIFHTRTPYTVRVYQALSTNLYQEGALGPMIAQDTTPGVACSGINTPELEHFPTVASIPDQMSHPRVQDVVISRPDRVLLDVDHGI